MKEIFYKTAVKRLAIAVLCLGVAISGASAKTLRLAYDSDPVTLDTYQQISGPVLQNANLVFDPLVRFNKQMKLVGRLATHWKWIGDRKLRLYLRKGVVFHSGNPFTAKDVKYTIDRIKDKSTDYKGLFSDVSAEVVNDYTIDVSTSVPYALLLNIMTYFFPMDSKFYAGRDEISKEVPTFASTHVSGTGPFRVSYRQQGVKVVYTAFKRYWDSKRGNVDKIILTPIANNVTRAVALLSGDVDFISPVAPEDVALLRRTASIKVLTIPGDRIIYIYMDQDRNPAFKDVRVRRAINLSVNNVGIAKKIMQGLGQASGQLTPSFYQGYDRRLKPRYNVAKARKLMKAAGYANGFTVSMMSPNNRYINDAKIAEAVAAMLSKINIKVNLKTMPKAQYWTKLSSRAADMMLLGWSSTTKDSANYYEYIIMCKNKKTGKGDVNLNGYCNKKLDHLITVANEDSNTDRRSATLRKAARIVYRDNVVVPLHFQNLIWAFKDTVEAEPILNATNFPYFGNLNIK